MLRSWCFGELHVWLVCINDQYLSVANSTVKAIIQRGRAKHINIDFKFLEKIIKRKIDKIQIKTQEPLEITQF